ncbi:hypothetical protein H5410_061753 [Solanum commersonii]|uniref:Uncharacterized protein n=1 Tax=Solanum commersonii TaxID=4109 RepID=A0A9J5W8K2_SOLCO|nr:hypothetical protein H5410_061753 [Solanum commersonii]
MDKGDVQMLEAEKNVFAGDVLVSNESPVEYENDVKTGKSNVEDHLNSKSHLEAHDNVVLENKTPIIDVGTDDMVSGYLKLTDDEVHNIDEGEVNEVHQSEKMMGEDPQMEANPTIVTTDVDARLCEFPKVKLEVTDSSIGKTPEPASPMFLINPLTANAREHNDCEDDEGSHEDQAAFLGNLGTFYWEKAMEFKPPRYYGHQLNCLKLWRSVIRLGGYDRFLLQYERHKTQNRELQLPIAPPPGSSGVDSEGSGYHISTLGRAIRDLATCCRLGWQEQYLLDYGEIAEPIVKLLLQYERHRSQNGELQLPIAPPPGSSGVDNEITLAVRDSAARCRLGWEEQHLLSYGHECQQYAKACKDLKKYCLG